MNSPLSVIKYGGNAIEDHRLLPQFAQAIAQLRQQGHRIVIVHGGGPQINYWLDKTNITSHFIDGQRVTDTDTLEIVEMALCAQVNKALVRACLSQGLNAVALADKMHTSSAPSANPNFNTLAASKTSNPTSSTTS